MSIPLSIPHLSESDASYELTHYSCSQGFLWAFVRNGEVVRWLDQYETNMIQSVIKFMENKQ